MKSKIYSDIFTPRIYTLKFVILFDLFVTRLDANYLTGFIHESMYSVVCKSIYGCIATMYLCRLVAKVSIDPGNVQVYRSTSHIVQVCVLKDFQNVLLASRVSLWRLKSCPNLLLVWLRLL